MSSAYNNFKQFGSDLDPDCSTLTEFLKEFFERVDFVKKNQQITKSMQNYPVGLPFVFRNGLYKLIGMTNSAKVDHTAPS